MPDHTFNTQSFSAKDRLNDLYHLFAHARYLAFRAREKELQRYNLYPEQAQILFMVQVLGKQATPAEIARRMLRQPQTVSALVKRMAKRDLVKEVKDLERKNMVRVALTAEGKKAYALTTKRGPIHRIFGVLNDNEQVNLEKYLIAIMKKAKEELGMDRDNLPPSEDFPEST
jgi:DNA-binding MarR family transcriptional regulator